jgi:RHS repeat-associated protein
MRSAPAPDLLPIPGMNQGTAVAGGSGGSGDGDGSAGEGGDHENANGGSGGDDADGDNRNASNNPCSHCDGGHPSASRGDPVDVLGGQVFTTPVEDVVLPGPLPFRFARSYNSAARHIDCGLGWGWTHSLAWRVEVRQGRTVVCDSRGGRMVFPAMADGEATHAGRWLLRRDARGFVLDDGTGIRLEFTLRVGNDVLLTAKRDRNENCVEIQYENARLTGFVDSVGRRILVTTDSHGHVTSLTVTTSTTSVPFTSYAYDKAGRLVSSTDADGCTARYRYDDHLLIAHTNRVGVTFHYRYDREQRCIETWGTYEDGRPDPSLFEPPRYLADRSCRAKGIHHHRFTYGSNGYREVVSASCVEHFTGTPGGKIGKSVHAGTVVTREYDANGNVAAVADGANQTTSFVRDPRGRLLTATDPLGRVTVAERDEAGRVVHTTDPAGGISETLYDRSGNILSFREADGHTTAYQYDERGLVTNCVEPNGATWGFGYDAHGNGIELISPKGEIDRRTFDSLGRKVTVTDAMGGIHLFSHSLRGDLTAVRDPRGGTTTYTYDGERRITAVVSPLGGRTEYAYGSHGKLHRITYATGSTTTLRHTLDGLLAEVTNEAGEVYLMRHDGQARLVEEQTFDGRILRYQYDPAGRVRRADLHGDVYEFEYDAAGQLLRRQLPDDRVEEFEYDALGFVRVAKSGLSTVTFTRDPLGRIVREVQQVGESTFVIDTALDACGRAVGKRTSLGYEQLLRRDGNGAVVERRLNGSARLQHVRDASNRELARTLDAGGRIQTRYDPDGLMACVHAHVPGAAEGSASVETRYGHDVDGGVAEQWDLGRGLTRYEHDLDGKITGVRPEHGKVLLRRYEGGRPYEGGDVAETRVYGSGGKVVKRGSTEYAYDARGALVRKAERDDRTRGDRVTTYEWSAGGHLVAVVLPDGRKIEYAYDAYSRRVMRRASRRERGGALATIELTRYVWDGDDLVHRICEQARTSGDPVVSVRTFAFADNNAVPITHRDSSLEDAGGPGEWTHYVTGPTGAPLYLLDGSGRCKSALDRDLWGAKTQPADGTEIGLKGQILDEDTGLAWHRFRNYDPATGRFIQRDPVEIAGNADHYAYPDDPLRWVDPLGLRDPWPADVKTQAIEDARDANGFVRCAECNIACARPIRHDGPAETPEELARMRREWQLDHINPVDNGGESTLENCQVLCRKCNRAKGKTPPAGT